MTDDLQLRGRSIRTLAWLGDVEFEREVRLRLSRRGDYPTDRLDKLRARLVRAEAQAELLAELIEGALLREDELAVVARARNCAVKRTGARRGIREYRAATALEALIAWWLVGGQSDRFELLIIPAIEGRIDRMLA